MTGGESIVTLESMKAVPTGPEIEAARIQAGVSTNTLAAAAGLSNRSHLRKIERGKIDPRAGTLRKIVAALDKLVRRASLPTG